jgi:vancomycin resistance protein YoaR
MLGAKSSYVNGTESRAGNIRIASGHINGTLLKPGDVFSYNQIVGPRNEDDGYRVAPILISGKHEKGIGGGICQTSGTLFNAVLKSGLKIVQRECHSTPIGYLPVGLDATVSYGSHDLKFQNDTDAPVYIAATMRGRELTFSIFGKKTPGREVKLVQAGSSRWGGSYTTQHDRSKPAGYRRIVERASSGGSVTWYRLIKENGKVIHRDVISSHYIGHPGIVVVGTGARVSRPAKSSPAGAGSTPAVTPGAGGPAPPSSATGAGL